MILSSRTILVVLLACGLFSVAQAMAGGDPIRWKSDAVGDFIAGEVLRPRGVDGKSAPLPVVVYLANLSVSRIGQEPDEPILADLLSSGHLVLKLDYRNHPSATSPALNADVLKLRNDLAGKTKTLLADRELDANRIFIIPEGCRLRRDIEFARDGERVLGMDLIYPSKPSKPIAALMEITCDNQNRMGSASLLFCRDTLLEGGAIAGFAAAIVDHPVPPPYKGLDDPMPQCIHRMKAAVRTLRALAPELGMNGNVGVIGFSRGATMAALLAVTNDRPDLEGDGPYRDVSSNVQAALIHGNRYDYLSLRDDDPMLARFEKAWGKRDVHPQRWAEHGATHYLTRSAAPMFLNTSATEAPEFRHGLAQFAKRLEEMGVEHVYQLDADDRGHRVSTDPKTLAAIYGFFDRWLK